MTNNEKGRHRLGNDSSFGPGHSFVIRHSSFVILACLLLLLESSCVPDRLRQANVDEVTAGMSRKQVESILGPPTETDAKDFPVTKTMTYLYRQRSGTVTIVFKDDKV
ncbi:MAG: outer membrane protein assembly factor BamE domain-containing protein, partial [Chthoniobacterales bacterium]